MRLIAMAARTFGALLLCVLLAAPSNAHTRSQSFSSWSVSGQTVQGVFQVDAYRTTQLTEEPQDLNRLLRDHLAATVSLTQAGQACTLGKERSLASEHGDLRVELTFDCPKPFTDAPATLKIGAFFDVSISHIHYVRVSGPGERVSEAVLTEGRTEMPVGGDTEVHVSGFTSFLTLGFEHVLSGVDHIAFLIALAMLAGGLWRIVVAVTGFTLGHSLTLALVALNVLRPESSAVEALIGFTVAWAAGDALARRRNLSPAYGLAGAVAIALLPLAAWMLGLPSLAWPVLAGVAVFAATMSFARKLDGPTIAPVIATVFGLAHGAGFAGPLLELHIPGDSLVLTLLAFNLGVEAGQLTALAVLGAVILAARAVLRQIPEPAFDAVGAALFALGTFWFVSRALA